MLSESRDPPRIDGLEIESVLGSGSKSTVFKARQTNSDRIVAVKILTDYQIQEDVQRLQREARLLSRLEHANVARVWQFGTSTNGTPFIVMEFIEGRSLAQRLKTGPPLQRSEIERIFIPLLGALQAVHDTGIIHRDLTPSNIMLFGADNLNESPKLIDFGIAKVVAADSSTNSAGTTTALLRGTPAYMSPEQCQGKPIDNRSDLYSLGCIIFECATGAPPFQAASAPEIMLKHINEALPANTKLSRSYRMSSAMASFLSKCLQKDPTNRYSSAAVVQAELLEVLHESDECEISAPRDLPDKRPGWQVLPVLILMATIVAFVFITRFNKDTTTLSNSPRSGKELSAQGLNGLRSLAERLTREHNYEGAREAYRQAITKISSKEPHREVYKLYGSLATCLRSLKTQFPASSHKYEEETVAVLRTMLLKVAQNNDFTDPHYGNSLIALASSLHTLNRDREALDLMTTNENSMKKRFSLSSLPYHYALNAKISQLSNQGSSGEAIQLAEKQLLLDRKRQIPNANLVAEDLSLLLPLKIVTGHGWKPSLQEAANLLADPSIVLSKSVRGVALDSISTELVSNNEFKLCQSFLERARIEETRDEDGTQSVLYARLGTLYARQGNREQAQTLLQRIKEMRSTLQTGMERVEPELQKLETAIKSSTKEI